MTYLVKITGTESRRVAARGYRGRGWNIDLAGILKTAKWSLLCAFKKKKTFKLILKELRKTLSNDTNVSQITWMFTNRTQYINAMDYYAAISNK